VTINPSEDIAALWPDMVGYYLRQGMDVAHHVAL
jgi:hypothetical protein